MKLEAIHKTNIVPLRKFANWLNIIGTPHLTKMFYMQDILKKTSGFRWKYHAFMWKWTYAVYSKYGTTYKIIDWETEDGASD